MSVTRLCQRALTLCALSTLLWAGEASAQIELGYEDHSIVGSLGGERAWSFLAYQEHEVREKDQDWVEPLVIRPARGEAIVAACVRGTLYELSARAGVVLTRHLLPSRCKKLAWDAGEQVLEISVEPELLTLYDRPIVTLTHELGRHDLSSRPPDDALTYTATVQRRRMLMYEAIGVGEDGEQEHGFYSSTLFSSREDLDDFEKRSASNARVAPMLEAYSKQDPTNPQLIYDRLLRARFFGTPEEELALRAQLLGMPEAYAHGLLGLVNHADTYDVDFADALFEKAAGAILRRGEEPELMSEVHLATRMGRPTFSLGGSLSTISMRGFNLAIDEEVEAAIRHADRLLTLFPDVEGLSAALIGLADSIDESMPQKAAAYRAHAHRIQRYSRLETHSEDSPWGAFGLSPLYALLIALTLLSLLKATRDRAPLSELADEPSWVRLNPMSRTSRPELVGLVLALGLAAWVGHHTVRGHVALDHVGLQAISSTHNGKLNALTSKHRLPTLEDTDVGRLFQAISHQQSGDDDLALALYAALDTPTAWNNVGVIRHRAGDADAAKSAWEEALAADPQLESARYNLGLGASGPRSARLETYAPELAMIELPSDEDWTAYWAATVDHHMNQLSVVPSGDPTSQPELLSNGLVAFFLFPALLALLALLGLPGSRHARGARAPRKLTWTLGMLLPGGARALGPLGAFVLAACLTSVLIYAEASATGWVSASQYIHVGHVFDGEAHTVRSMGFGTPTSPLPLDQTLMAFARAWWVIWIVGVGLNVVAEILRPDPASPFYEER